MKGNFHVQFLGEGVAATSPPYPTLGWATTQVYPARISRAKRRTDTGFPVNKTVLVPLTMPNRHRRAIRWGSRLRFRFSRLAQARFCSPGIPSQI